MVRLQKVNFHIDNIYNLDLDFLQSLERKYILIDLDNTLDAYNVLVPAKRTYELLQEISSRFMIPIIIAITFVPNIIFILLKNHPRKR